MKKTVKSIAILAVASMVVTGCQKENMVEFKNGSVAETTDIVVWYTVDGVTMHASFSNEAAWEAFLDKLIVIAEEGHLVTFRNNSQTQSVTKEVVTFVTESHAEALDWSKKMAKAGYEVSIDYDETTGEYTCTAIK